MAGTIVNNMTALNEADAATWTCTSSESLYTNFYREATGCLGLKLNTSAGFMYTTPAGSPLNMSNMTMHGWTLFYVGRDTYTNGGMSLLVGDGTNRAGFPCAGSDVAGYHATPDGWSCIILSVPDKVDGEAINLAGTTASINDAAITQIGYYLVASTAAVGNVDNTFWDIVWAYDHTGYAAEITAGTDVSPAGFSDLSDYDESTATQRGLGVLSQMSAGVFSNTAPVQVGDAGTGSSHFEATNEEIIFEDVGHLNNHKFAVVGNSTGTNAAYFTSFTFRNVHSTLTPTLNFNGGNIDALEFAGCTFLGIDANFSNNADASGHSITTSTFDGCDQIDPGDVPTSDTTYTNTISTSSALLIDADGTSNITDINLLNNTTGAGVEFSVVGSYDIDNWQFSGNTYDVLNSDNAAAVNSDSLTVGLGYKIATVVGDDFTTVGAADNNVGTKFVATGTDAGGTGTTTEVLVLNKANGSNPSTCNNTGTNADHLFVGSVSVNVTVVDESTGVGIDLAHVQLYLTSDYTTEVLSGATNSSGVITGSWSGSTPVNVEGWARQMDILATDYEPADISGTIGTSGLSLTVKLKPLSY